MHSTLCEDTSSASLPIADTALTIVGSLESQSSNSLFENSPSPIKDIIESGIVEDTSPLALYSSYVGIIPSLPHLVSTKYRIVPIYRTVN